MEFANPQVQVPLTGARRQIQFPRPFGGRGGGQRGPNVPAGPETYQHYHRLEADSNSLVFLHNDIFSIIIIPHATGNRGVPPALGRISPGQ